MAASLKISVSTLRRELSELQKAEIVKRVGSDKKGHWIIAKKQKSKRRFGKMKRPFSRTKRRFIPPKRRVILRKTTTFSGCFQAKKSPL